MPIDHVGLQVPQDKFQDILEFYKEALKPLNYEVKMQFGPCVVGMGPSKSDVEAYNRADFWLTGVEASTPNITSHVALRVNDRAAVDGFHAAGVKSGGKDNGAPGPRPHYHANYYGAFIIDPVGNNIEVVCHEAM
ncbi:hypothetical protein ACRE_008350 [Hapsidospora chrysogenum ATCC 11550]|uniref:VOC domain-containing protein n=1 Tax=Hapsidospora chrysogenum (strain ATCC 11550 / CBS 779.69 / DSM 880 / IAM 14645 / JCM 23072 / IMI 49137) TaxID=857340 RepID=A0A086TG51_HAPC1|nr:hypothetical protein ACRE_008350 [Hapsidospora chrysogenum ATCC 11550]